MALVDDEATGRPIEAATGVRTFVVVAEDAVADPHQDDLEATGARRQVCTERASVGDIGYGNPTDGSDVVLRRVAVVHVCITPLLHARAVLPE